MHGCARLLVAVLVFIDWSRQQGWKYLSRSSLAGCGDDSARTLFLLEGVAAEEVDLVVGVYLISFVMVRSCLFCFVLCLLINKNGFVHHNDAEAKGLNFLFEKLVVHWGVETHSCQIHIPVWRVIFSGVFLLDVELEFKHTTMFALRTWKFIWSSNKKEIAILSALRWLKVVIMQINQNIIYWTC